MQPLSVSTAAGAPWRSMAPSRTSATSVARVTGNATDATQNRLWSSTTFTISTPVPSARAQWVMSDCQHSLGSDASKRTKLDLGRLAGWGTTKPRRTRTRQELVEPAGVEPGAPGQLRHRASLTEVGLHQVATHFHGDLPRLGVSDVL